MVTDTESKVEVTPKTIKVEASAPTPAAVVEAATKPALKAAKEAAKPRRGRPPKAVAKASRKTPTRRAKPARRAKVQVAAKTASPAAQNGRNTRMTIDTNNWFAGLTAVPGADKFQNLFADFGTRGQDAVAKSTKVVGEIADLTKGNVEALVNSSRIAAAGAQSLGQEAVAYGRDGIEQASRQLKTLAEAKSPTEFLQLQGDFARASFDRLVAESSRLTETMVKLAGEAIQPLSNRATVSAERINTLVA